MLIRPERPGDAADIDRVTAVAFAGVRHSAQTEAAIVAAVREAGATQVSLVAEDGGAVVGHVLFSPVRIDGDDSGWVGLGPVSVVPAMQRRGIGAALIREGLARIRGLGAAGCAVLGDPHYYARFGFAADPRLAYAGAPAAYFQSLAFDAAIPTGEVTYHPGFAAQ